MGVEVGMNGTGIGGRNLCVILRKYSREVTLKHEVFPFLMHFSCIPHRNLNPLPYGGAWERGWRRSPHAYSLTCSRIS